MDIKELKSLFPLQGKVTEDIILNSVRREIYNCPGANTLRQALLDKGVTLGEYEIYWGVNYGFIKLGDNHEFKIKTVEEIDFMDDPLSLYHVTFTC